MHDVPASGMHSMPYSPSLVGHAVHDYSPSLVEAMKAAAIKL